MQEETKPSRTLFAQGGEVSAGRVKYRVEKINATCRKLAVLGACPVQYGMAEEKSKLGERYEYAEWEPNKRAPSRSDCAAVNIFFGKTAVVKLPQVP